MSEEHPDEIEDDGDKEAGQEVDGLAVLDAKDAEAGAKDEDSAHDAEFHAHRLGHPVRAKVADGVEEALPAEEDGGSQEHGPAVGGGQDCRADEVEGGIGVEEGVGRFAPFPSCCWGEGGEDGAYDGEGADAIEEAARDEALNRALWTFLHGGKGRGAWGKRIAVDVGILLSPAPCPLLFWFDAACKVEPGADEPADGEAEDEEHGELALCHIGKRRVHAEHEAAESESVEEDFLILLADA